MITLGLRLLSQTPLHADADDSELLLETLAVSDRRFDELDQKPPIRARKVIPTTRRIDLAKDVAEATTCCWARPKQCELDRRNEHYSDVLKAVTALHSSRCLSLSVLE